MESVFIEHQINKAKRIVNISFHPRVSYKDFYECDLVDLSF
jgi:hypothetical protein